MNHSLIIEVYVTRNKEPIGKMKDNSVFLLNDAEIAFHYKPIEKYVEKQEYEYAVSEYIKWKILIKTVFGRKITVFQNIYRHCTF